MVDEATALDHITSLSASGESEALKFKETTGTRREVVMMSEPRRRAGGMVQGAAVQVDDGGDTDEGIGTLMECETNSGQ